MNIKKHLPWLGALLPIINAQADTNPNVVIIYIDDMGIGDIGCYGGKFVATPNIDKLAQDGLLFNQYYSSAPVSSPSRCGLTTGLFPIEVGINTFLNDKASNKRCEQRNLPQIRIRCSSAETRRCFAWTAPWPTASGCSSSRTAMPTRSSRI